MGVITLKAGNGLATSVESGLFINNEFVEATAGETLDIENPFNTEKLATLSAAQEADVNLAVNAAEAAFYGGWKTTLPPVRAKLLHKLADLIEQHADELALLEALDAGILFNDSKGLHVPNAVSTLRYFAGWTDKIDGKVLQIPEGTAYTLREPIGVCAAIVPWNCPLMITSWKLAPAIAAGNTLIIKTPEAAPLWGQKLASLVVEAGFPAGVINILCGEGAIAGAALSAHQKVKKVSFTGSTASHSNLVAKGPSIVFSDADWDNALFWTSLGCTTNNGQICAAGSRIYVQDIIYDKFLQAFTERINKAVHGDPVLQETTKGPVINASQQKKILSYIEGAKNDGTRLLHGGEKLDHKGYFVPNTAFADVPDSAAIMKEEIFGSVPSIAKFSTEKEAIQKANDTEYGLSAAVFTNNVNRAQRVSAAIESGQVTINCWGMLHANTPFGGVKQSGFGRDLGEESLDGWLNSKTVKYFNIPEASKL
ncbi:putative aldehyde dehydrogenase [Colletotrichum kahawae]|uniref:aldehyde dehydrogenase (NAD(+)) n=1 Tax=Colletotrichum kahawae TaxID=34407 RepID=A0AAD9YQ20_COLKA|nr:putative aldehyde dehydrogenase [Colletotrichum kahawae]